MKKLRAVAICITMILFISGVPAMAEDFLLTVSVYRGDHVLIEVKMDPNYSDKYTEIRVYNDKIAIPKDCRDLPTPVYWKPASDGSWADYQGEPGKYYVYLLDAAKEVSLLTGPVEFEIPEITATPTSEPKPTEPSATSMPALTSSPAAKATASATLSVTAGHTASEGNRNIILWTCIGAAALVIVGVVVMVLIHKKNKN